MERWIKFCLYVSIHVYGNARMSDCYPFISSTVHEILRNSRKYYSIHINETQDKNVYKIVYEKAEVILYACTW